MGVDLLSLWAPAVQAVLGWGSSDEGGGSRKEEKRKKTLAGKPTTAAAANKDTAHWVLCGKTGWWRHVLGGELGEGEAWGCTRGGAGGRRTGRI